jgi:hypothetical protein
MKKIPDIEVAKKMINLQQSATSRNIEFDLTFETVKHLMTRTHCYYTGIKFEDEGKLAFSVDRVDSKKGYVEGNVVACTVDINSKKSNLSHDEIRLLNDKINEFLGKTKRKAKKNEETDNTDVAVDDVVQSQE